MLCIFLFRLSLSVILKSPFFQRKGESNLFFNGSQLGVNVTPDSGVHLHVQNSGEANMILEGDVNGIGGYLMLKNNNTTANTSMAIQFLDGGGQGTSEIKGIYADNSNNDLSEKVMPLFALVILQKIH